MSVESEPISATTRLTPEEINQLQRTVEMFEAITESQADDYQSLEILKEAFTKLGKQDDVRRTSIRLAQAYAQVGQVSQAILEYEGILQKSPGDEQARGALGELEAKTQQFRSRPGAGGTATGSNSPSQATSPADVTKGTPKQTGSAKQDLDGEHALADLLISEKVLTRQSVQPLLDQLKTGRQAAATKGQPLTLLQLLVEQQICKLDDLLSIVVTKSAKPYLPLSFYDVDRDTALLLPRDVCFESCIIPFDLISRSVLIATANPFDETTRDRVRTMLDYNVFWYISPPAEIISALRHVHGLDAKQPTLR